VTRRAERGGFAVLAIAAVTVILALTTRLIVGDGSQFVAGMLVGIPLGALLGWLADLVIPRLVDRYISATQRER